jgi:hypothetical protein
MPRFDVTIAGEVNLDLILYGVPEELLARARTPCRQDDADFGRIVRHSGAQSRCSGQPCEISVAHRRRQFRRDRTTPPATKWSRCSRVRRTHSAVKTGITVILQRERWRNMVTYAGTTAKLAWDDLDFDYLIDSRHFHISSFYLQRGLRARVPELFSPDERCWTHCIAGHE